MESKNDTKRKAWEGRKGYLNSRTPSNIVASSIIFLGIIVLGPTTAGLNTGFPVSISVAPGIIYLATSFAIAYLIQTKRFQEIKILPKNPLKKSQILLQMIWSNLSTSMMVWGLGLSGLLFFHKAFQEIPISLLVISILILTLLTIASGVFFAPGYMNYLIRWNERRAARLKVRKKWVTRLVRIFIVGVTILSYTLAPFLFPAAVLQKLTNTLLGVLFIGFAIFGVFFTTITILHDAQYYKDLGNIS